MLTSALVVLLNAGPNPAALPLRALVLYENGLGYFERTGSLAPAEIAEIPLEPGQLDDALKSLVVVSEHPVASIEFSAPLAAEAARSAAGMPTVEEEPSLPALLNRLAGVEVNVTRQPGNLEAVAQLSTVEARDHLRGSAIGLFNGATIGTLGSGSGGYGSGQGSLSSHSSVGGSVAPSSLAPSDLLEDGPTPLKPAAVSEAGELFLYTVKEPVFLAAHKSALLPIIDRRAEVETVSVIDATVGPKLAMRFSNDTGLTLENGTVSVFADGVWAGEAQLDRIKPGEVRVVKHAEDLDVEVSREDSHEEGGVKKARRTNGATLLELHRVDRKIHRLKLVSRSLRRRTLLLELPAEGYRVTRGAEEDIRSPGQPRYARVLLKPKEQKDVEVVEEGAVVERIRLDAISTARLDALLASGLPAEAKAVLAAVRLEVAKLEQTQQRRKWVETRIREVEADVGRLRENLAAAGKGSAQKTADELGHRLLTLEDEFGKLRGEQGMVFPNNAKGTTDR